MQYLLDTNICVFFLHGKFNLNEIIDQKGRDNCFVSEITVLELRYGAENSADSEKSHKSVDDFIGGLKIIPVQSCSGVYSKEKVRLRKTGFPVNDEFDLIIGSTAVATILC